MPTKNINTNSNKNNIKIDIDIHDKPKRRRTPRRSPPSAPVVQNVVQPPPYNSAIYYPNQTTFTPDNVPVPQGFESARTNQATTMGILSRSAQHVQEAENMRAMYDQGTQTMTNPITDISLPTESEIQPIEMYDNPLAEEEQQELLEEAPLRTTRSSLTKPVPVPVAKEIRKPGGLRVVGHDPKKVKK